MHHLAAKDLKTLGPIGGQRLRSLGLRELRSSDLSILNHFPLLENLMIWQSAAVQSLTGIEQSQQLRRLCLSEVGPLSSLRPLSALGALEDLLLTGGVWNDQRLSGDFSPLASLRNLKRLTIAGLRGPTDVTPLLGFDKLEYLWFPTARYPRQQVARLAARYPFWASPRPWVVSVGNPEGCEACGSDRVLLLLQRSKRIWCEHCDAVRLERTLAEFDTLIDRCR